MESPYLLTNHVFLSVVDDSCILLDLEKDKYLSIDGQRARALARHIAGWPAGSETGDATRTLKPEPGDGADISALINQGLLTRDPANGKQASTVRIATPASALARRDLGTSLSLRLRDIAAFMRSSARVVAMLRWWSIGSIIRRIERRKCCHATLPERFDMTETERLLAVFDTLRPFFPAKYLCLSDSLLFLEFLAQHRIYPTWVFGVRIKPWGAHCWLQQSEVVLNDAVERVRNFTPIMAI